MAHLIELDYTNTEAVQSILSDRVPEFFASYDEDLCTYNGRLVVHYKITGCCELVKTMRILNGKLIKLLRSIPAEEFDKSQGWRFDGEEVTITDLLQTELDDERMHLQQIAEFGR